jgi:hypothetical protein
MSLRGRPRNQKDSSDLQVPGISEEQNKIQGDLPSELFDFQIVELMHSLKYGLLAMCLAAARPSGFDAIGILEHFVTALI